MTDEDDPTTIGRYDWERLVKRARMSPATKLVALAVATYADKSGTRMYPGVAKLAAVTGLTEKTVRSALKTLRDDLGLLQRTFDGSKNGRRGLADVYRLRRPHDIEQRTHLLDPAESTDSTDCHGDCQHPGTPVMSSGDPAPETPSDEPEHRNSVPRTPVMSSGTPVMSSPNTGTHFPPSSPDHPRDQPLDQRDESDPDVTTTESPPNYDAIKAELERIDELDARRRLKVAK